MKNKFEGITCLTKAAKTELTNKWENHPANKEVFDCMPSKDIGRQDRKKQMEWVAMVVCHAAYHPRIRIFEDACLYSKDAMIERRNLLPKRDRDTDFSSAPYWIIKEHTWQVIPIHGTQDIAGYFYWNTDYWESIKGKQKNNE